MSLFAEITQKIGNKAKETKNELGWRFLLTSRESLSESATAPKKLFLTCHPGGDEPEPSQDSTENNLFFKEQWKDDKHRKEYYENILNLFGCSHKFNEDILFGYYCPFRLPKSQRGNRHMNVDTKKFCDEIWSDIVKCISIKTIVTFGSKPRDAIKRIMQTNDSPPQVNIKLGDTKKFLVKNKINHSQKLIDFFELPEFRKGNPFSRYRQEMLRLFENNIHR